MRSYEEVQKIREPLDAQYLERHDAHRQLRNFWHGRYWDKAGTETGGVSSIFKDLTSRSNDVGPDIKLVYNVLKDVCVKFQSFLTPLPMIRMYVDPPSSSQKVNQATIKERYLYGMWSAANMNRVLGDNGWYLPLMGDAILGVYPDLERNTCRAILRSPEVTFPLPRWDGNGTDGFIFKWDTTEGAARRAFPEWEPSPNRGRLPFRKRKAAADPKVEIMEFSDRNEFVRYVGGKKVAGVEHNFGFDLFDHVKFINVPDEVWGHGAVEQAVNLVEMGNAYLSLMMQSAIENVFPTMVLEDPQKAPEEIEKGAGAVIPVNAGGKVYYLVPPSGSLLANAQWGQEIERMVKSDTSMPDVNFGNFSGSVATGKAINELQGAGTGSLVEMVQGIGIGAALTSWNEKALHIGRTMFRDEKIHLFGQEAGTLAEINPRHFSMTIKGSQLVGSNRNEVVFMPHLDMHSKVVMGLQLAGAGLVSKRWQRDQVGIPDSDAMDEELVTEAIRDGVLGALIQSMTDPPAQAEDVEKTALSYIEGGAPTPPILNVTGPDVPGGGPVQPGGPAQPPGGPGPPTLPGPTGEPPPVPLPPGAAPPQQQASPEQMAMEEGSQAAQGSPQQEGIPLDAAISALQNVPDIEGQVWLVGEIVANGIAHDVIEIDVTVAGDRARIAHSVQFPCNFHVITTLPDEPFVEVTPGAGALQGGADPDPEQLIES